MLVLLFPGSSSNCDATTNRATVSTVLRRAVAELKMPQELPDRLSQHRVGQPTNDPIQPLVTQMQPPMLPPPPHPNFQSVDLYTQLPVTLNSELPITRRQTSLVTSEVLHTTFQYLITESQSHLTLKSLHTQLKHQISEKLMIESDSQGSHIHPVSSVGQSQSTETFTETSMSQPSSKLPVGGPFFKVDSYSTTPTQNPLTQTEMNHPGSVTQLQLSKTRFHQLVTETLFYQSYNEPAFTQTTQTKLKHPAQPQHQETHQQPSPSISQLSQTYPQQPFTLGLLPKMHLDLLTTQHYLPSTQPSSVTESSEVQPPLSETQPQLPPTQHPTTTATPHPMIPVSPQVNMSDLVNATQQNKSANDTKLTEWLKRNTSQSPMTSNDPR